MEPQGAQEKPFLWYIFLIPVHLPFSIRLEYYRVALESIGPDIFGTRLGSGEIGRKPDRDERD